MRLCNVMAGLTCPAFSEVDPLAGQGAAADHGHRPSTLRSARSAALGVGGGSGRGRRHLSVSCADASSLAHGIPRSRGRAIAFAYSRGVGRCAAGLGRGTIGLTGAALCFELPEASAARPEMDLRPGTRGLAAVQRQPRMSSCLDIGPACPIASVILSLLPPLGSTNTRSALDESPQATTHSGRSLLGSVFIPCRWRTSLVRRGGAPQGKQCLIEGLPGELDLMAGTLDHHPGGADPLGEVVAHGVESCAMPSGYDELRERG